MTNISPVEDMYKWERASTVPTDMAAQILYLTDNVRRLQADNDQWEDAYDTPVADVISLGGTLGVFGQVRQNIAGSSTAMIFSSYFSTSGDSTTPFFSWSSANTTQLTITNPSADAAYLITGTMIIAPFGLTGVRTLRMYTSTNQSVEASVELFGVPGGTNNNGSVSFAVTDIPGSTSNHYIFVYNHTASTNSSVILHVQITRVA